MQTELENVLLIINLYQWNFILYIIEAIVTVIILTTGSLPGEDPDDVSRW